MQTVCGFVNCNNKLPKEPFKIGYTINNIQREVIACAECGTKILRDVSMNYSISPGQRLEARPASPLIKPN